MIEALFVWVNIIILLAGIFTILVAGRAYLRFMEGEFKTLLKWVVSSYVLFILYKSLNVIAYLNSANLAALLVLSDLVFLIAIACVLMTVKELHHFSKAFGFLEHKMPKSSYEEMLDYIIDVGMNVCGKSAVPTVQGLVLDDSFNVKKVDYKKKEKILSGLVSFYVKKGGKSILPKLDLAVKEVTQKDKALASLYKKVRRSKR